MAFMLVGAVSAYFAIVLAQVAAAVLGYCSFVGVFVGWGLEGVGWF